MRKLFLFILFFLFFLIPGKAFAQSNFSTDYNVTYSVSQNANTKVNIEVILTNKTDQYYASSYSIQVGFKNLKNLTSSDAGGSIKPDVIETNKGSNIEFKFNSRVVGIGNKLVFNVSFDTDEVAHILGSVKEINIPGISNQNDFTSFNVNVVYPQSFGKPSYTKPFISRAANEVVPGRLTFKKEELGTSGISMAFGDSQVYSFDLNYNLGNSNLFPVKTEIALPPTTNYQDVSIEDINPRPINVRRDSDGNWLAQYLIAPSKKMKVKLTGKARLYLNPKEESLASDLRSEYLKPKDFWDSENQQIKKLAKELKNPYAIYRYVVSNLEYDFSRVTTNKPRLGASRALSNPQSAVCLEFTDLFIALSRAAGIPAREVNGFAYTKNPEERPLSLVEDVLHSWPEYYDDQKKMWIMVDPTWGNTTGGVDYFNTLDFDHFAFIVKGSDSEYPIPAGGYKLASDVNTKDVHVELSDNFTLNQKVSVDLGESIIYAGISPNISIKVTNSGSVIVPESDVSIETQTLKPSSQKLSFLSIPPFGSIEKKVEFESPSILTNKEETITISSGGNVFYKKIRILPFFFHKWILGGILFVSITITISLIARKAWRLHIQRRKQSDPLRGEGN